jgi:predicted transglutaminase-like cysteine proteinase
VAPCRLVVAINLLLLSFLCSPAQAVEPTHRFPAIFDSREIFSANLVEFTNWTGVLRRARAEIAAAGALCSHSASNVCQPDEWQDILRHLAGLSTRGKVEYVNTRINAHPYVSSLRNWGTTSYWETPFEFFRRNGQCQDYATTKFLLLRAAGIPNDAMRLVVVHDFVSQQDHALVLVDVDGEALMLDNQMKDVLPADRIHRYRPYYSINETGWWQHVPRPLSAIAGLRPAVAPRTDG